MRREPTPFRLRRVLLATGGLLLLFGGIALWRVTHPHLTDEEQIAANLSDLTRAAAKRNARGITQYLGSGFDWQGKQRQEVQRWLAGGFIQSRDLQLSLPSVSTQVNGERATTSGTYDLSFRQTPEAPVERHFGDFKLHWQRQDGQWKIVKAEGGAALPDE
ncbi:MAG TPA: hypothetical protein VNA16_09760 [Abditibacteriaceae bacterium]|nr:hypothetical protein [Abditibacteriaceae bacterium]